MNVSDWVCCIRASICCLALDVRPTRQIICDMFEDPHSGMVALLDEQSQMVGSVTDMAFLHYLDQKVGKHPHYTSYQVCWTAVLPLFLIPANCHCVNRFFLTARSTSTSGRCARTSTSSSSTSPVTWYACRDPP